MRQSVFACIIASTIVFSSFGTIYYLDAVGGNDQGHTGTSPEQGWKSIGKMNAASLVGGDMVLFKRGQHFRGQILPRSGSDDKVVIYSAYGTGEMPVILGSDSKSALSDWVSQGGNKWKCNSKFDADIGNIYFGGMSGVKKWNTGELAAEKNFCYDAGSKEVIVYASKNPASAWNSIELALGRHMMPFSGKGLVVVENLHFKYGGAHGIHMTDSWVIIVQKCHFSYIGGAKIWDGMRYGNAVEMWASNWNCTVDQCIAWEIYDTPFTNQSSAENTTQENLTFTNNIAWNSGFAGIEIWANGSNSIMKNIRYENNTITNVGYGWGAGALQRSNPFYCMVGFMKNTAATSNVIVRNNIFYTSNNPIIWRQDFNGWDQVTLDYNCYWSSLPANQQKLYQHYPSGPMVMLDKFSDFALASGKGANSMARNPGFVSHTFDDLHISSSSPCKFAGFSNGLTKDVDGDARTNGVSIGADQYTVSTSISLRRVVGPSRNRYTAIQSLSAGILFDLFGRRGVSGAGSQVLVMPDGATSGLRGGWKARKGRWK